MIFGKPPLAKPPSPSAQTKQTKARASAALLKAVATQNLFAARNALAAGADINSRDSSGRTPLLLAIRGPEPSKNFNEAAWRKAVESAAEPNRISPLVQLLLKSGAAVNIVDKSGGTPLIYAAANRNAGVCRELLRRKANPDLAGKDGMTALVMSALRQDIETLDLLLKSGAKVSGSRQFFGLPLLAIAIYRPSDEKSESDDMGSMMTAMMGSLMGGGDDSLVREEIVARLLRAGIDPNETGKKGITPLITAAGSGTPRMIRLLIEKGAKPDLAQPQGATPLFFAAALGRADTAFALLDAGASITATDTLGDTPLTVAAENACYALVDRLLKMGADPDARTKAGKSARDLAAARKHTAIVRLLDSRQTAGEKPQESTQGTGK